MNTEPSWLRRQFAAIAALGTTRNLVLALYLAALVPPALLLTAVDRYAVDVPFMDDWQFVPLIEKVRAGEFPWKEFAAPHDEHRLLVPRLIIVAAVIASNGDYRVQCFITFAVVAALSLCFLWLLRRSFGTGIRTPLLWCLLNTILFSPIQWHNWLWPMQFAYFLPFVLLGACCMAWLGIDRAPMRWLVCSACAWAASFSFVHGLLLWPTLLPLIWTDSRFATPRRRHLAVAVWLGMGALATFLYFNGLQHNSADPVYAYGHEGVPPTFSTLKLVATDPVKGVADILRFAVAMFGNAISRGFPAADSVIFSRICGAAVLALAVVAWMRMRSKHLNRGAFLAAAVVALHGFLTAALVSIGRAWQGENQPMTPRYTTFGTFCLLGAVWMAAIALSDARTSEAPSDRVDPDRKRKVNSYLATAGVAMLLPQLAMNWVFGLNLMFDWRETRLMSRAAVHFSLALDVPFLGWAGGHPTRLRPAIKSLSRLGFLHPPLAENLRLDQFEISHEIPHKRLTRVIGSWPETDGVKIKAQGVLPRNRVPHAILVTSADANGVQMIRMIAQSQSPPHWMFSGFNKDHEFLQNLVPHRDDFGLVEFHVLGDVVPPGESRALTLWMLDFEKHKVYPIPGELFLPAS